MPWTHKIPDDAERPCGRDGCTGEYELQGRPHFDADGHANIGLRCPLCGLESSHSWQWNW